MTTLYGCISLLCGIRTRCGKDSPLYGLPTELLISILRWLDRTENVYCSAAKGSYVKYITRCGITHAEMIFDDELGSIMRRYGKEESIDAFASQWDMKKLGGIPIHKLAVFDRGELVRWRFEEYPPVNTGILTIFRGEGLDKIDEGEGKELLTSITEKGECPDGVIGYPISLRFRTTGLHLHLREWMTCETLWTLEAHYRDGPIQDHVPEEEFRGMLCEGNWVMLNYSRRCDNSKNEHNPIGEVGNYHCCCFRISSFCAPICECIHQTSRNVTTPPTFRKMIMADMYGSEFFSHLHEFPRYAILIFERLLDYVVD